MLIEPVAGAPPEAFLKVFAVLTNQIRAVNEREFRELLSQRTLAAEMEAERQKALTQMVAGVAHELNTPLGIINTAASIIEREIGSPAMQALAENSEARRQVEDIQEALELIKGNIQRAHRLVQDFKKVSVSQLSDVKEPMDLSEAVQETVNLAQAHLRRSGLIINIHDSLPVTQKTWVGYRGYLSQVLLNLLTNIERYAYAPGPARGDITLALEKPNKFAITVRDNGKGMSEEVRAHIFEPFYTTGRATGGTGLGMAIVHNLVTTALKGAIRINSTPGQGTEVIVTFPRSIPD
jgi:signal transduction histidine kinase